MATVDQNQPYYPTISGDWNEDNYDRRNIFGVAKAKVEQGVAAGQQKVGRRVEGWGQKRKEMGRATNKKGQTLRREAAALIAAGEEARGQAMMAEANRLRQQGASTYKTGAASKIVGDTIAKASMPLHLFISGSWTSLLLICGSTFGLLFLLFYFGARIMEETLWGFSFDAIKEGAMVFYVLQCACSFLIIASILSQFKFTGLHPLGGRGAMVKQVMFALILFPLFVPGGPFFLPWQVLWLAAIARYPT
jgi:hypothetical protein